MVQGESHHWYGDDGLGCRSGLSWDCSPSGETPDGLVTGLAVRCRQNPRGAGVYPHSCDRIPITSGLGSRRKMPTSHKNPVLLGPFLWKKIDGQLVPYIPAKRVQSSNIRGSRDHLVGIEKNPGPTDNKGKEKDKQKSPVQPDPKKLNQAQLIPKDNQSKGANKRRRRQGNRSAAQAKQILTSIMDGNAQVNGALDAKKEMEKEPVVVPPVVVSEPIVHRPLTRPQAEMVDWATKKYRAEYEVSLVTKLDVYTPEQQKMMDWVRENHNDEFLSQLAAVAAEQEVNPFFVFPANDLPPPPCSVEPTEILNLPLPPPPPSASVLLDQMKEVDKLDDYVRGKSIPDSAQGNYFFPGNGNYPLDRFDDQVVGGLECPGRIIIAELPKGALPMWAPWVHALGKAVLIIVTIWLFQIFTLCVADIIDWVFPVSSEYSKNLLTATRGLSSEYFHFLTANRDPLRAVPGFTVFKTLLNYLMHLLYHMMYVALPDHWMTNLLFAPVDLFVYCVSFYTTLFTLLNVPWRLLRTLLWLCGNHDLFYEETGLYYRLCPISLGLWLFSTNEKIKNVRLVLIPRKLRKITKDYRPEGDRTEKLNGSEFWYMHVAVEVRSKAGNHTVFRYYKDWAPGKLPDQWYKASKRTLKTVLVSPGLLSSALNRKTMMADNAKPEVAIDTMVRMMQANPHYQAELHVLTSEGLNMYRDMSLVFGALIAKDVIHDNKYF